MIYHSWNMPGPFALPLVVTPRLLTATKTNSFDLSVRVLSYYRPITKCWAGLTLYISSSRPEDVEKVLTTCLDKSPFYDSFNDAMRNTLLTSKVNVWKEHRKMINPCFNTKVLHSFFGVLVEYSKKMLNFLNTTEGAAQADLMSVIWEKTYDAALASLTNVKPQGIVERYDAFRSFLKFEEIFMQRFHKIWLLINFIFKHSDLYQEHQKACNTFRSVGKTIVAKEYQAKASEDQDDTMRCKRFLPHLIKLNQEEQLTHGEVLEEMGLMSMAASETTTVAINTVLTVLGIYPDIQEKVYEELNSVLPDPDIDPTFEDLSRLQYLDRVIKETMRLMPTIPYILRYLDQDIKCDPYVFPAGSNIIIPIVILHRDPNVWPDPEKFDPDRFLPDEVAKRHRCSYIPFSYGARNCIGLRFAKISVKLMVCMIMRNFKIRAVGLKSWKDIRCEMLVVLKPKNCCLSFEKR